MAINYELLNKGGISLGTNFELLSEKPLDSRLVVPSLNGLQNYIDNAAAYEGMIVFDQTTKKTYQVQTIDGVLSYREFGINEDELKALIAAETTAAMEFKGAATALPENPAKGDMYKVTEPFKVDEVDAKVGDSIVYDGTEWFIIPSGDDIEDTWRPVAGVDNDASLTFADGEKTVAAVAENGTIKINHAKIEDPKDVTEEADKQTRTYLTAVVTDDYGHITGYKTATENVEDTNTEYTFESQVESSNVYFNVTPDTEGATEQTIYVDAYSKNEVDIELDKKLESVALDSPEVGKMRLTIDGEAQDAVELNGFAAVKETAESALQNAEGENAIGVNVTDNVAKVTLKLDNTDVSRVELSQGANGLKVDVKGELTDTTYTFADGTEEGTFLVTEEGKTTAQTVKIGGETASQVKEVLIGKDTDTEASDTIKGAKKYTDKKLEVYTTTENLTILLNDKADKKETYTKTEVDKVVADAITAALSWGEF